MEKNRWEFFRGGPRPTSAFIRGDYMRAIPTNAPWKTNFQENKEFISAALFIFVVSVAAGLIQLILDNFFIQQSTKIGVEVNRAFLGHRHVCVDRLISRKKAARLSHLLLLCL